MIIYGVAIAMVQTATTTLIQEKAEMSMHFLYLSVRTKKFREKYIDTHKAICYYQIPSPFLGEQFHAGIYRQNPIVRMQRQGYFR